MLKIVVLCGGVSSEREVSLKSGAAVDAGLREAGYETVLEDVVSIPELINKWPSLGADGAFIALHGGWGEDGRLQSALDADNIPYTGSGAKSCVRCMDKEMSRDIMTRADIPAPPGVILKPDDRCDFMGILEKWGKIVIKPASNGSTLGVAVTSDLYEARNALNAVWDIDTKAVIEQFIPGKELTVVIFGSGSEAFAMPVIEIRPHSGFYDYKSKYTAGATEYICPAPLNDIAAWTVTEYARRSHVLLGCRTYSRIDFRLSDNGAVYALEVNTAPGMTPTSLVPKAAKAYGWGFPKLLDNIVTYSFRGKA
ncbi:MAG: D-alanine--D-alanine ligase [Synergistaceae bacterium]|jgi:D-alanine-D-alanine ligase|nr:D-alanine--D-alanine ligase [Synergistaceae bacterium]